jgi:hypothetical protein
MARGFNQLVTALEARFDFQSARITAREALARAGLAERSDYDEHDLQRFADGLSAVARNLDKVWLKLGVAPSGQPLPAPSAAAAPVPSTPAPVETSVAQHAPEEAVEAPPAPEEVVAEDVSPEVVPEETVVEEVPAVSSEDDSGRW